MCSSDLAHLLRDDNLRRDANETIGSVFALSLSLSIALSFVSTRIRALARWIFKNPPKNPSPGRLNFSNAKLSADGVATRMRNEHARGDAHGDARRSPARDESTTRIFAHPSHRPARDDPPRARLRLHPRPRPTPPAIQTNARIRDVCARTGSQNS